MTAQSKRTVALMAKMPRLGEVKTRLAKTIGDPAALEVYRALLQNVMVRCRPTASNAYSWGCFVAPEREVETFASEFSHFNFVCPQQGESLGERMAKALGELFETMKAERAVLIGADIPDLSRDHCKRALEALRTNDVCWGPTGDGGYYLVGMSQKVHPVFEGIEWGTNEVLEKSIELANRHQLKYHLLPPLADLDTIKDLNMYPQFKRVLKPPIDK